MITMNELVDLRMQQHIAHEIYRHQIMQRIPDPFPPLLPMSLPRHVIMPPRVTLPGVEVTLQNDDLWKQFHQIGTEMIITKCGRRMFPSMRISLSGLDEEANYCVLLEMVPIGDCRYKFSGSQWVPAGGAEPQSPQRMYLHPDSPATGAHFQAQPLLFNKVKLTNNTLDNNGHVVLASMHKYQPRIHVIRTSDLAQIPWAPQQAFVFPETEFVAVTAYQNDRITKLKIDNNPFAKGFRESGQSRCKRKMSSSPSDEVQHRPTPDQSQMQTQQQNDLSPMRSAAAAAAMGNSTTIGDHVGSSSTISSDKGASPRDDDEGDGDGEGPQIKRMRSNGSACSMASSLDEVSVTGVSATGCISLSRATGHSHSGSSSSETSSPHAHMPHETVAPQTTASAPAPLQPQHQLQLQPHPEPLVIAGFANDNVRGGGGGGIGDTNATSSFMHHFHQNMQTLLRPTIVDLACSYFGARPQTMYVPPHVYPQPQPAMLSTFDVGRQWYDDDCSSPARSATDTGDGRSTFEVDAGAELTPIRFGDSMAQGNGGQQQQRSPTKRKGFSISAILGGGSA